MRTRRVRLAGAAFAVAAVTCVGVPGAAARADVPAYGTVTISDAGLGLRTTWSYEVAVTCRTEIRGPGGVPQAVRVRCKPDEGAPSLSCPLMMVTRTTLTVVGARSSCHTTVDMGVGTSGTTSANLGHVDVEIVCEAYVDNGVLVPPYTVTCAEPGLPDVAVPGAAR
jgi:hypothetical protein